MIILEHLRSSLRYRLLAYTIPVVLLLAGLSYLAFHFVVTDAVTELACNFAEEKVRLHKEKASNLILREVSLAKLLSTTPSLIAWAMNENDAGLKDEAMNILEHSRTAFRDGSYFFVIDKSGHYYYNNNENAYANKQLRYTLTPDMPEAAWYYATKKEGLRCQINVNNAEGLSKVWINCLMRHDGKMIGMMGTGIDLTGFIRTTVHADQPGVTNLYINRQGAVQAAPDVTAIDFSSVSHDVPPEKSIASFFDRSQDRTAFADLLERVRRIPHSVETMTATIRGVRHVIGIASIPEIGWFNVTVLDLNQLPLQRYFLPFALLLGVGMVLLLVLLLWFLNHMVLSRIHRLDEHIRKVEAGDYAIGSSDAIPDEIGRLSGSFVNMAAAVMDHAHNLEQQVRERTAALELSARHAQEGRDQLDAMISCAMDGIIHIDTRGIVRSFNPAAERMFGYGAAEVIGRNISILMPEPDRSQHDGYLARYLAGGEGHVIGKEREVTALRKDGNRLTIALHVSTMSIRDEHYFIGTVRDITERKQAETLLRQAKRVAEEGSKAKSRFLSAASHDLRQPLQALRMFTEILASYKKSKKQAKLFDNILKCQHTIQSMLDSLLDISRLDAGMLQIHIETVAVPEVFEHMQSAFAPLAEEKNLALFTHCPQEACIQTDLMLIERILGNLLGNAIRYTEGGMVLLACRRRGNRWRLEVRDSGAGIAAQDQASIFEEFHQLHNRERNREEGLGLGLAIVKRLCALLEHDIELRSSPGRGSTFTVTAPACGRMLVTVSGAVENNSAEQPAIHFQLGLVIDDDPLARDSLFSGMRTRGYTVRTAANRQQAEQLVAQDCPDFIVCDYRLPDDNGIKLIQHLWQCAGHRIPSVLLTGDTANKMRLEAKQEGIPVVTKPSGIAALFSALRK